MKDNDFDFDKAQKPDLEKIQTICKAALCITEDEFAEAEQIANEQLSYVNPLRGAKQSKFHKLGRYNLEVLTALKSLQVLLKSGNPNP